ncbi:beta-1,3-galactosyltransferase 5 isoform X2 [Ixodes scapularis]|uniref:Hexosyltransferase n=2 Tax=Ixodes scapularis TaxID=6945 RepID=B7Q6E4_IXOSC|nr:beta-1,3-galactosyltransferase 5 isoform X2 [Ixodes scapularis]XP_040065753.1 beta-1,3-galactosyltransferase 5 isoform X2 [Ixodes scapularis]EEC14416.1 galactosyltransferase, putative [Ixodes scapularis]|eukprot:XP_002411948.1 galactosyltransferase, putative [Ixodes scapularis]
MLGPRVLVLGRERRSSFLAILGFLMLSSLVHSFWYFANTLMEHQLLRAQPPLATPAWTSPQGAYNLSVLDEHSDPRTLLDRSDFHYVLNSDRCGGPQDLFLVVFVHSAPTHWDKRRAIRETWGNASVLRAATTERMALVFMVGRADDSQTQEALVREGSLHGDLVMGNFVDSYRNLTYKHVMGLKWVTYFCRNARYVLKTDDDVFMDLFQLTSYLRDALGALAPPNLMMCVLIRRPYVKRSQRSKWRVSFREYRGNHYPPYCSGWGVVMSPDVVFNLYRASAGMPYFWVDDVLITGILAQRIGLTHVDFGEHLAASGQEALAWLGQAPQEPPPFMGHPDLDTDIVYRLWNKTRSYVFHTW